MVTIGSMSDRATSAETSEEEGSQVLSVPPGSGQIKTISIVSQQDRTKDDANRSKREGAKEDQVTDQVTDQVGWRALSLLRLFDAAALIVLAVPCGWRCFRRIVEE